MSSSFGSSTVQVKLATGSISGVRPKLSPIQGQLQSSGHAGDTRPRDVGAALAAEGLRIAIGVIGVAAQAERQPVLVAELAAPGQLPTAGRRHAPGIQAIEAGQRQQAAVEGEARAPAPGLAGQLDLGERQGERDLVLVVERAQALEGVAADRGEVALPDLLGEQPVGQDVGRC